jgi:hypothetical protein
MKEQSKVPRWLRALVFLVAVLAGGVIASVVMVYSVLETRPRGVLNEITTPTRDEVTKAVARLIQAGRAQELYAFYAQDVGDPVKAMLYVSSALMNAAPVHLVMSVGWFEGGHIVGKVDGPNEDGSYDVRPMGLNTFTYHKYSVAELKQVEFNIPTGVVHLVGQRVKWSCTWESAMAAYNHGRPDGLDSRQIDYVTAVLRHEWELDRRFAARFPDAIQ